MPTGGNLLICSPKFPDPPGVTGKSGFLIKILNGLHPLCVYTMIRIGLLGCGNIGHIIAKHQENFEILALYDLIPEKAQELADISGGTAFEDFNAFIRSDFDLVVEAASVPAVRHYAIDIINSGKDVVVMSVGALSDKGFLSLLTENARRLRRKIYIPSGAVMGLDNIKVGQISGLRKLLLKTTKSPESLGLESHQKRLVFSGKAHECIREFPKNVNVSVAPEPRRRVRSRC